MPQRILHAGAVAQPRTPAQTPPAAPRRSLALMRANSHCEVSFLEKMFLRQGWGKEEGMHMAQAVRGVRIWAASFSRDVVMRRSFVFAPHQSASISLAGVRCFSVSSAVRAAPRTGGDAAAAQDAACATPGAGAWFWDSALGDCMSYPNVVLAQEVLGRVHVATGLPWWATIAVTTLRYCAHLQSRHKCRDLAAVDIHAF